ncbi:metallophosphoesterase family protein [Nannocystis bainbridge]|uniref:Phosphoesterase n=1 Tax=Nannocystis bainbridge TaxID=2995303 RepID=A0ABT5DVH5_9BACT|nr:metallophosphoesterase family protein [Nannocystis bainbridge]MDC0716416.1 metallophosphoesterase family protein [Nannocystis bainbridge]
MAYARAEPQSVRREALHLRDGALRIVAVADTHSRPHPGAMAHIAALEPQYILHAGDVGELAVLTELERIAPVFAVRGNIDAKAATLPDLRTLEVRDGDAVRLTIAMLHIAVAGPRLRADAARFARAEDASLVVCGHSHVPFIGRDRGIAVFNPGSIGPRRFQLPIVFGVLDITPERVGLRHVDCETGAVWTPPT